MAQGGNKKYFVFQYINKPNPNQTSMIKDY